MAKDEIKSLRVQQIILTDDTGNDQWTLGADESGLVLKRVDGDSTFNVLNIWDTYRSRGLKIVDDGIERTEGGQSVSIAISSSPQAIDRSSVSPYVTCNGEAGSARMGLGHFQREPTVELKDANGDDVPLKDPGTE